MSVDYIGRSFWKCSIWTEKPEELELGKSHEEAVLKLKDKLSDEENLLENFPTVYSPPSISDFKFFVHFPINDSLPIISSIVE